MKLPLSLLKEFIPLDKPIEEIVDALTLLGIEVDGVLNKHPPFSSVVAGKVVSCSKHPKADRLQIAEVFDGEKTVQLVCGGPNCRIGLITAFAKVGAVLHKNSPSPLLIQPATLRGIHSDGMLCTKKELDLSEEGDALLELPEEVIPGTDLVSLFLEPVLELSFTPNLGHAASAIGIARELAAYFNLPLSKPTNSLTHTLSFPTKTYISADVLTKEKASRYSLAYLEQVEVGPSPFFLKTILENAGMRSINNVVDITNLIMLELGQPLHAFDYDLIEDRTLQVAILQQAEEFECLDGERREIPKGSLVIQDKKATTAIAGIMGGSASAVSPQTKRVVLEAAHFDSSLIRTTAKKMSLRTESALRFEKKTDPEITLYALQRACYLLQLYAKATPAQDFLDLSSHQPTIKKIHCRLFEIERILGIRLSLDEVASLLQRYGLLSTPLQEELQVVIPSYRHDLNEEIDLIEEIAKLYGLNHFQLTSPTYTTNTLSHSPLFLFEKEIKNLLLQQNVTEWITCDLISPSLASLLHEKALPPSSRIEVLHAKSLDTSILRQSLLPNFLDVIRHNLDHKNQDLAGFEIGKCYFKRGSSFQESLTLSIALTGNRVTGYWQEKPREVNFYDLKGIVETLLQFLSLHNLSYHPSSHANFHPHRQLELRAQDELVGVLGEIHPDTAEKLSIKQRIYFLECNLDALSLLKKGRTPFMPIPQFPSSERDWTVTTDRKIALGTAFAHLKSDNHPLLEQKALIDIYQSPSLGENKQNVTFRFIYRSQEKTLSFEEVEEAHKKVLLDLENHLT